MLEKVIMNIADIRVPSAFSNSVPKEEKMELCRRYYREHGCLDRDILLDSSSRLRDGYIGLLVLIENGVTEVEVCKPDNRVTYVFGRHNTCPKDYCWKINGGTEDLHNLKIGNKMVVQTKHGVSVALITNIIKSETPPVDMKIKRVIKCLDE